jgi:hypothetical protein
MQCDEMQCIIGYLIKYDSWTGILKIVVLNYIKCFRLDEDEMR